jgi:anti-anti-sigma regulatory factor
MQYQTEIKEKFIVVKILDTSLSSNLVPDLAAITGAVLEKSPKNLVLNLEKVSNWELPIIEQLAKSQELFYDNNASFVICCLSDQLESILEKTDYFDIMNTTPTESEAWDIVQMEEIERELLDGDDMEFSQ